jgi:hypothetical protein
VRKFRALEPKRDRRYMMIHPGDQSYPMCRALTSALVGQCLGFNTMNFEELLIHYAPRNCDRGELSK